MGICVMVSQAARKATSSRKCGVNVGASTEMRIDVATAL